MKKVGEVSFSMIPGSTGRASAAYRRASKIKVAVVCRTCGAEERESQGKMRAFNRNGYQCKKCWEKEKKEFNESIIAMAKRKGLIKQ
jgi:hypothetical protein